MECLANGYISTLCNSALKNQVDGIIIDHRLQHKDAGIVNLVLLSREGDKTA